MHLLDRPIASLGLHPIKKDSHEAFKRRSAARFLKRKEERFLVSDWDKQRLAQRGWVLHHAKPQDTGVEIGVFWGHHGG